MINTCVIVDAKDSSVQVKKTTLRVLIDNHIARPGNKEEVDWRAPETVEGDLIKFSSVTVPSEVSVIWLPVMKYMYKLYINIQVF